jgi:hypothetical protein
MMSGKVKGSVRRSQLVTTYGVGAIVAIEDESFMVAGIDRWTVEGPNLHEPRLERQLNVSGFVVPPATDDGPDVPVVRFPTWESCPSCRRLDSHRFFTAYGSNRCGTCEAPLVPSRFVVACRRGHIDDFPYFRWVHAGTQPGAGTDHVMSIDAAGNTASLRAIQISCSCGQVATMEGAFGRNALKGIMSCTGKRPWLGGEAEDCPETPRTLQRGASNVWFPVVASALSIPPWSEGVFKLLNKHWPVLRHLDEGALTGALTGMGVVAKSSYTLDDFLEAIAKRRQQDHASDAEIDTSIRGQEYEALLKGREEDSTRPEFVCTSAPKIGELTAKWFDRVMLVKRLREVRVLDSFTRLLPPSPADDPEVRAKLYASHPGWLPAIEVTGEGVFLRLRTELLQDWEVREDVRARVLKINDRYAKKFTTLGRRPDRVITPRLLLIHTLAHALINQWSLDSGYPAASLRERLYVSDGMTGLLIYTATTDSAGSLGGVVAQAEASRLDQSLIEAVMRIAWCSSDPLCIEADAAGVDSLNLAACHACVLLPEVSCEEMNVLLDRALLVGTPDNPGMGFFAPALATV